MKKTSQGEAPRPFFLMPATKIIKNELREYFEAIASDGRRLRFGGETNPQLAAERECRVWPSSREAAFVAVAWDWGFPVVGESHGGMCPNGAWEVGVSVHPDRQGTSLAVLLLRAQIVCARVAGASEIEAMVTGGSHAKRFFSKNDFKMDKAASEDPQCPIFNHKLPSFWQLVMNPFAPAF